MSGGDTGVWTRMASVPAVKLGVAPHDTMEKYQVQSVPRVGANGSHGGGSPASAESPWASPRTGLCVPPEMNSEGEDSSFLLPGSLGWVRRLRGTGKHQPDTKEGSEWLCFCF